ncbi:O-antigen ligase family protein [Ruficoccus amylovorans]|uniref:O-antigen ligase family protein n=1 Tax=Ruficoccus amylovorans TaxID=1804625 RepID=A0A842HBY9_9BACT|nr:O-antigen ligase family protein [Ruficoccus amylovorans]MBC2593983.1 O-antigen ligase family protein [Ruficoccus amylovorans]
MPISSVRERRRPSRGRIREETLFYRLGRLYHTRLRNLVLPAWLFLVVVAGGGTSLWAQALVLIVGGLAVLIHPPYSTPGRGFDWAVLAWILTACLAFLPGSVLGRPDWWESATGLGIELPGTFAPAPYLTLEALLLLLGGVMWFYLIWQWKPQGDEGRQALSFFSTVTALLALAVAIGTYNGWTYPLGRGARVFSFFDNRNQMATVLAIGGVISFALAMQAMRKGKIKGIWHLVNTLVVFVGLAFCQSRAGLLLFGLGCVVWFAVRLRVSRVNMMFKLGAPIFILCLGLLVIFGRSTLERFSLWESDSTGQLTEMRLGVYQDAAKMALDHPVSGVGLGNFGGVFPQYRDKAMIFQSIIHPESDWMWVFSEMGFPGLIALLAALIFLMGRLFPFGEDRTAPFRAAAAVALLIFILHSLIDVPGHRFGTFLLAALLYRLAAAPAHSQPRRPLVGRWAWRLVALICLGGGLFWLVVSALGLPLNSRLAREKAVEAISQESIRKTRDATALLGTLDRAIDFEPLWWWYYSVRGQTRLSLQRDEKGALEDFRRARFLDKTSSEVSFYEGKVWLDYNNRNALAAWRDALNRQDPNRQDLFRKMLEGSLRYPRFQQDLSMLTRFDSDFRYSYLLQLDGPRFREEIKTDILTAPELDNFTPEQRGKLLEKWALKGDQQALVAHLDQYPGIVPNEAYYRAIALAGEGKYDAAVEALAPQLTPARIVRPRQYVGTSLEEHRQVFSNTPGDPVRGLVLLDMQIKAGDYSGARRTADTMSAQKQVPPALYYWKGEVLRNLGLSKEAWEAWYEYTKKVPLGFPAVESEPTP